MKTIGIYGELGSNKMVYAFRIIRDLNLMGYYTVWGNFAESLYQEINKIALDRVSGKTLAQVTEEHSLLVEGRVEAAELLFNTLDPKLIGEYNPDYGYSRRNENFRKSMDIFATQIRRAQDENYFIHKFHEKYNNKVDVVVSTDLRFPNEVGYIQKNNGVAVEILPFFTEGIEQGLSNSADFKYSKAGKELETETSLSNFTNFNYSFNLDYFSSQAFCNLLENRWNKQ